MPRPADNYTHSQFEIINADTIGETAQCKHCRNWTSNVKVLNRKKDHLMRCPEYKKWRESGHGQELPPSNPYRKRDSTTFRHDQDAILVTHPSSLQANESFLEKHYQDIWDESSDERHLRVRCLYCGLVRTKNGTFQFDHLISCREFLNSPEGQDAVARGEVPTAQDASNGNGTSDHHANLPYAPFHTGAANSRSSSNPHPSPSGSANRGHMPPPPVPAPRQLPSLTNHLINKWPGKPAAVTQQQFLSHAGCGTLSASALSHWLGQNGHITRAMVSFVGSLIGKVRLPETTDVRQHTLYRTTDLLISAASNLRKELDFLELTKRRYHLDTGSEPIAPISRAYIDMLASASDPKASLLEGLLVLWASEHFCCESWLYAATFTHTMPSSNYSVPSYLSSSSNPWSSYTQTPGSSVDAQVNALRDAIVPNWTSRDFCKFVDACKAIVDETANTHTSGSGRDELIRCESHFSQVMFLWERIWPEVDGMGQEHEPADVSSVGGTAPAPASAAMTAAESTDQADQNKDSAAHDTIEVSDANESNDDGIIDAADSPYGGTGLAAVEASNRAG